MPETTKFNPSPYQALIDAGFSPDDARKALAAIVTDGYDVTYSEPRTNFETRIRIVIAAHSAEQAAEILDSSGVSDGPAQLVTASGKVDLAWINVEDQCDPSEWRDDGSNHASSPYTIELIEKLGATTSTTS